MAKLKASWIDKKEVHRIGINENSLFCNSLISAYLGAKLHKYGR